MRSLLGRFHRPFARSADEQLLSLNNLGDGSTLSLDFTTGVLDPRLTFTRTSNATFINSSGLVEWAAANMVRNSQFSSSGGTPTSWTASVLGSGAVTSASGEVTCTVTTAGRAFIYEVAVPLAQGITYSVAFDLVVVAGSSKYSDLILPTAGATLLGYYLNGVALPGANAAAQGNNTASSGRVTVVFTSGSGSLIRFGPGSQGSDMTNVTVKFSRPSVSPGNFASPAYYESTNATTAYYAPRFDYDPTSIGTPRGLLIEGSANNLVTQSNGSTSVWTTGANRTPTNNTTDLLSPDGTNNATKLVCGSAGAYASFATSISGLTGGATYTISYWIRGPVGHQPRLYAQNGTIGDVTATATTGTYNNTGWTRLTQTYTLPATTTQCLVYFLSTNIGTTGETFYVYGFQMETGSGASSHIPTGASQGTRNRDELALTNLSSISFNQSAGTVYSQLEIVEKLRGSFIPYGSFDTSGGGRCWWWLRHNHDVSSGQRILGNAFNTGGTTILTTSNYTHSSGVFKFATSLDTSVSRMVYAIAGGSPQVTTASAFTLATAAQMSLNKNNDVTDTDLGSMWVRMIKYWPTALPDSQLQSLTT